MSNSSRFEVIPGGEGSRQVWRATIGSQRYFVKRIDDQPAENVGALLRSITDHLPAEASVEVPNVIVADSTQQLLVTEELDGIPLQELLSGPDREGMVNAVRRTAHALAELHRLPMIGVVFESMPVATMQDHVDRLISPHPLVLAEDAPGWEPLIRSTLDLFAGVDPPSHTADATLLHCDFHVRQLIIGTKVGVVDWDLAARGDPLFDVGFFMTYLETHTMDPTGLLRVEFLAAYLEATNGLRDEVEVHTRLRAYRMFNLLRRACRRHRLRDTGWETERDRMLSLLAAEHVALIGTRS